VLELERLPGHELVQEGLRDLEMGRLTIPALLVAIGSPKLRRLGFAVPHFDVPVPEHRLYQELSRDDPDSAHSRYNALLRRLVSFEHAAEHASRKP
jgi:hypothetical protein